MSIDVLFGSGILETSGEATLMTLQELIQEAQRLSWQEQLHLATRLLQWAEAKMQTQDNVRSPQQRQPDLHPGAFLVSDDFDEPLPDSFWLGEG